MAAGWGGDGEEDGEEGDHGEDDGGDDPPGEGAGDARVGAHSVTATGGGNVMGSIGPFVASTWASVQPMS